MMTECSESESARTNSHPQWPPLIPSLAEALRNIDDSEWGAEGFWFCEECDRPTNAQAPGKPPPPIPPSPQSRISPPLPPPTLPPLTNTQDFRRAICPSSQKCAPMQELLSPGSLTPFFSCFFSSMPRQWVGVSFTARGHE